MALSSGELISRRSELRRGLVADRFADARVAALGLRRMRVLMERLDNPHYSYPVVHIAGSKGKGTTAHLSAALLSGHGLRAGRYTSPHLHSWSERIAIDDHAIAEADFASLLARVDHEMSDLEQDQPELGAFNTFELLTSAAFVHFAERAVDIAVIEVGLGGRFDSTNVVRAAVSVITRIEREHADILGPDLPTIAWNKAGIVASNAPVVVSRQEPDALAVIEEQAAVTGSLVLLEGRDWTVEATETGLNAGLANTVLTGLPEPLPGAHNRSNLGAALCAVSLVLPGRNLEVGACRRALRSVRIPGRFERLAVGTPPVTWVLDVAHTRESIISLLDTAALDPALRSPGMMLALLIDKPADDILEAIAGRVEQLIVPQLEHPRAITARDLADSAGRLGIPAEIAPDIPAAIEIARAGGRPMLVTGSFTIVSHVQEALVGAESAAP